MEIALLYKDCLRIKGKHATFVVDPSSAKATVGKASEACNAIIVMAQSRESLHVVSEAVVIDGPGEYEIAGVKMSAISDGDGAHIFNLIVDGVEILLGKISSLEKMRGKIKEQSIIIVYADSAINASSVASLATNAIIFYGDQAKHLATSIGKSDAVVVGKYSALYGKLPQEVESVVLE